MIRGLAEDQSGREVYVFGLTPENIRRLVAGGQPILVTAESMNRGASYPNVLIFYGESHDDLENVIRSSFNVTDDCKIFRGVQAGDDHPTPSKG